MTGHLGSKFIGTLYDCDNSPMFVGRIGYDRNIWMDSTYPEWVYARFGTGVMAWVMSRRLVRMLVEVWR